MSKQPLLNDQTSYVKSVQEKSGVQSGVPLKNVAATYVPVATGLPPPQEQLAHHEEHPPSCGCRDWPFMLLFWLNLIGYIAFVCVTIIPNNRPLDSIISQASPNGQSINSDMLFKIAGVGGVSIGLSLIMSTFAVLLTFVAPKGFGMVSICLVCCYAVAMSVWGFVGGDIVVGVCGILLVLVELWTLYNFYSYADFATTLVAAVRVAQRDYRGTWAVGAGMTLLLMAWTGAWGVSCLFVLRGWSWGPGIGVLTWALFTFYWVCECIKNVAHVSVAGSVATWYFIGAERVRNATRSAFFRAITLSFGSIALGSMIVAILQTLRRLFQLMRYRGSRQWYMVLLSCIARLFLVVIEALMRLFNKYVYTIIAIYGLSYVEAAKKTKSMFGKHGFEMVMQNNVLGSIIVASTLVIMGASAGIAYVFAYYGRIGVDEYWLVCVIMGAVVAAFIVDGAFIILDSGTCAILVAYLCEPDVIRQQQPVLAQLLDSSYVKFATAPPNKR